jgi:hypothetical protein
VASGEVPTLLDHGLTVTLPAPTRIGRTADLDLVLEDEAKSGRRPRRASGFVRSLGT